MRYGQATLHTSPTRAQSPPPARVPLAPSRTTDVPRMSLRRPRHVPRTSLGCVVPSRIFRTQWGPSRQCGLLTLSPLNYSLPHLRTRPPPTRMPVFTIYLQRSMHMLIMAIHYMSHIRWESEYLLSSVTSSTNCPDWHFLNRWKSNLIKTTKIRKHS